MPKAVESPESAPEVSAKEKKSITPPHVVAAYLLCAIIWGTTWYAIRVCIGTGGYAIYPAAAWRFTFSAIILAVVWLIYRKKINGADSSKLKWVAAAGLCSACGYGLLYSAEQHISGGLAAVISANGPLVTALIAMVTGTEKSSRTTIIGSTLAMVGVAIVFHDRLQFSPDQASAVGLLVINVFCSSASNVFMKRHGHSVPAVASNTVFFLTAALGLWLAAAATDQPAVPNPFPLIPTVTLAYLTIFGTLITFAAFFHLLKHVRLSTAMTLAFVTPMIAVLIDGLLEKQVVLTTESYIGMAVVLAGVATTVLLRARNESR